MTNEDIKNKWYSDEPSFDDLLNLARQDEREKMQGVEVWVSWDKHHKWEEVARISTTEPVVEAEGMDGAVIYKTVEPYSYVSKIICKLLNISPGQCKKFRIVEEL